MRIKKFCSVLILAAIVPLAGNSQLKTGDFEKFYNNGVDLFQAEKFAAARDEFSKAKGFTAAFEYKPYAEEIDYYIAASAAESGSADAEGLLAGFFARYPDSPRANDLRLLSGDIYRESGRFEMALEEYGRVNRRSLGGARLREFHFNRGFTYFSLGDFNKAAADFDIAENDPALGPAALYYKAYIDYNTGNLDRARAQFTRLLAERDFADIAPFYITHIDFQQGNYAAVVAAADGLIARSTEGRRAELMRITGESYYHLGNYEQALRYLNAYSELKAGELTREELYLTGMSSYMTGDFNKAVDYLGRVAAGDGALGQNAGFHAGNAYLRSGDKQRAMQAYSLAMNRDEDREIKQEAMFNFAKLQYELGGGMFNQTINTVTRYLEEFPDSPNTDQARQYLLAAYLNSHDYAAAYDALTKIKNPDANMKMALQRIAYYRGLEYFTGGDYAGAQKMFEIAAENRYNAKITALTRFWMAETYYRRGEYMRAVPLYREYITLSPRTETENIMANYNLAYCYFNVRNMDEARVWFERFIGMYGREDGIKADAYNRIGDIFFLNRDYPKALAEYDKAIRTATPEADYARYQRALALGLTSGATAKIDALQAIINSGRGGYVDDAMYELGSSYLRQEQFDRAVNAFRSFIDRYPQSPLNAGALTGLGLAYQNMGQDDQALNYYKTAIEQYPNSPQSADALLGLRNIYMARGDAAGYFEFAASHNMETDTGAAQRDSLSFAAAEKIYLSGDARRARPLLERYLEQYPGGSYIANATYYMADADMREGDANKALEGYKKVAAMPSGPFTINSLINGAAISYQRGEYAESAQMYRRLAGMSQTQSIAADALSGYISSIADLDPDPDEAIEAANYAEASQYADQNVRTQAELVRGKAYLKKSDAANALPALRKAAANGGDTRYGAEARYLAIQALYDTGNLDEAEKEVFAFAESDTPYRYWLGRAFLTLGDVYLKKGDTFQARATFNSIVDGYGDKNDGITEQATAKLNSINE